MDPAAKAYAKDVLATLGQVFGETPYFGGPGNRLPQQGQPYFALDTINICPGTSRHSDNLCVRRDSDSGDAAARRNIFSHLQPGTGLALMRQELGRSREPDFRASHVVERVGVLAMHCARSQPEDVIDTARLTVELSSRTGKDGNEAFVRFCLERWLNGMVVGQGSTLSLDEDLQPVSWYMRPGEGLYLRENLRVASDPDRRQEAEDTLDSTLEAYKAGQLDPTSLTIYQVVSAEQWARAVSPDPDGHYYMLART